MLNFPTDSYSETKCYATHGVLSHVDPKQPPVKRKPFSAILKHDFVQQIELLLPEELHEIMLKTTLVEIPVPSYSRVILPLEALLTGEFFNLYIKTGDISMLSEGIIGVDNVYTLKEGLLTLHLDKESYERSGLSGQPEGAKGKRGTKPRWVVELNLRLPSMLHGKKGFDRIVYAFKNVLNVPVTWLFINLEKALEPDPLDAHFPVKKIANCETSNADQVKLPPLEPPQELDESTGDTFEDYAVELHEWISLALLNSPRIRADDSIDPFLSRYEPPGSSSTISNVVKVKWRGFISPLWARDVFVRVLQAAARESWFVICIHGFDGGLTGGGKASTILRLPRVPTEYVLWDIA